MTALLALAVTLQPTYNLLLRLPVGSTARYDVRMVFDDGGNLIEMTGKAEDKITKVDEIGNLTNEHLLAGVRIKIDKQEVDVTDTKRQTTVIRPTGEIVELVGASPQEGRFAFATMLVVPAEPVKLGQIWTQEFAPKGGKAIRLECTTSELEKVGAFDSLKIRVKSWETIGAKPIRAEGVAWIGIADGRLAKLELKVEGVPFGDDGHPVKLSVTMVRTS